MNNDKKIIFVNNPAATCGGALTILKQFISETALKLEKNITVYVFCTVDLSEYERENVKIINNIKAGRGKERVIWDLYGLKKWSCVNRIRPNIIISLQNTAVKGFKNVKQLIYLHQSIPYYTNVKWNIVNKEHRKYWFYRYIYKIIIGMSLKNNYVVVQTDWMKRAVIRTHKLAEEKVLVIEPKIELLKIEAKHELDKNMLFYPAANQIYKNHITIIKALDIIVNYKGMKDIKLYLTLDKKENLNTNIMSAISKFSLENNVIFLGHLKIKELIKIYLKANIILFPSYIETVGLPLVEASQLNRKIIVSDLDYSREVLSNYSNVKFVNYSDYELWAEKIVEYLDSRERLNPKVDYNVKKSWNDLNKFIIEKMNGESNE